MGKKEIFVILHGEKIANTPNPGLTEKGLCQIQNIVASGILPINPGAIICGTGTRHLMTAKLVGWTPNAYSPLCGCPDSSDLTADGKKIALLGDGTSFPINQWMIPNTRLFCDAQENGTLLIAGRPFMLGLGFKEAKEGMVIKITTSTSAKKMHDEILPVTETNIEVIFSSDGNLDIH